MENADVSLTIKKLQHLIEALEAAGPDPHGEIDWGEDVGEEKLPIILENNALPKDEA